MTAPGEPAGEVVVADAPTATRYEARVAGRVAGFAEYRLLPDRVVFTHTEVDPSYEGQGVGGALVRGALDDARARGLRVVAVCPFVKRWIERHPDYHGLVVGAETRS